MAPVVDRLLDDLLGTSSHPRISAPGATVGTTAIEVFRNDGDRLAFTLINLSANVLYLAPTPSVSTTRGIRLRANGGFVNSLWNEELILVTYDWHLVADASGSAYFAIEMVAL